VERSGTIAILSELGRRLEARGGTAEVNLARHMLAPEVLGEWLARYPFAPVAEPLNVLIITAGNIPFVGVQDLICVLAAGHRALVRPSSRDSENMAWAVATLLDIEPSLPVSIYSEGSADDTPPHPPTAITPAAVIAMGGDAAMVAIGARYEGVPTLLRGHRASAAVLAGDETADELRALADDALLHSGLGCRNVSLVFVPRDYDFAPLAAALAGWGVSAGVFADDRGVDAPSNGYRQTRAMLRMTGVPHVDCGGCLLVEDGDFSARPSVLNYAFYDDPADVDAWLKRRDGDVQCVACAPRVALRHPRTVRLGDTQRPRPWDYPDGIDTMQFLARL